jgi:hypothetical protein
VTAVPDQQTCHTYIPSSMLRLDHIITDTDVRHTKALSLFSCYCCMCVAYCRPFNQCICMMVGVTMIVVATHASLEQLDAQYQTLCLCMLRYVMLCACMLWYGVRNVWVFVPQEAKPVTPPTALDRAVPNFAVGPTEPCWAPCFVPPGAGMNSSCPIPGTLSQLYDAGIRGNCFCFEVCVCVCASLYPRGAGMHGYRAASA